MKRNAISALAYSNSPAQFENKSEPTPPLTKYSTTLTLFLLYSRHSKSFGKIHCMKFVVGLSMSNHDRKLIS